MQKVTYVNFTVYLTFLQTSQARTVFIQLSCLFSAITTNPSIYTFVGVCRMASGGPVMNGDISRSPSQTGALEDTLKQMNILIQENRDLKEALHKANISMKERFEGLAAWKEKQKEEKGFLESKLSEAKIRVESLMVENQDLRKKLATQGGDTQFVQGSEVEALRAQVARLQAEKNDLVALNSELQLKADHSSNDDSFIEIIKVTDGGANGVSDACGTEHVKGLGGPSLNLSMSGSRLDSEEVTVSQLLQSLRDETQRAERLQEELLQAKLNYSKLYSTLKELENKKSEEQSTQTTEPEETKQQAAKAASEVENLKSQVMTLYKDLQQAQSKLDEAEGMKKNLTDRCREVEQDVATLKAQLVDRQTVQSENDRLKLQLDSMQAQSLVEQRKAGEERSNLAQLKEAYTKLFEDYNEMKEERKKRESQLVQREVVMDLEERLGAAEKALVAKQEQIDEMKRELFEKEKELETINLFKLQAEVYSSDFHAERAAREKIHEEKERLAAQLEFVKMQNTQLQEEMDSLGRHSLNEMQRRHTNQPSLVGRGAEWQQGNIPEHACPKCNEILPDLDSLQIHIMDCIN
ncbi:optineurin isoform X2 [Boleophthalmus pectinirostris]|uniref:optineurin isoform X2 n=1 Tax=Boleophthalmus pectinirostris TaxID=150288 RepID=UPI00242F5A80|nr:optineurin isoform X2 [Boleophthalmus pectinirostris]